MLSSHPGKTAIMRSTFWLHCSEPDGERQSSQKNCIDSQVIPVMMLLRLQILYQTAVPLNDQHAHIHAEHMVAENSKPLSIISAISLSQIPTVSMVHPAIRLR